MRGPAPHGDPLVITLKIAHYKVCLILVDNGSSLDLLYLSAFLVMGIDPKEIMQHQMPLLGFNGSVTISIRSICLLVYVEGAITLKKFLVLNTHKSYNAILGRPWIHKMQEVPSTYHQLIKYPTVERTKEIKGE